MLLHYIIAVIKILIHRINSIINLLLALHSLHCLCLFLNRPYLIISILFHYVITNVLGSVKNLV